MSCKKTDVDTQKKTARKHSEVLIVDSSEECYEVIFIFYLLIYCILKFLKLARIFITIIHVILMYFFIYMHVYIHDIYLFCYFWNC